MKNTIRSLFASGPLRVARDAYARILYRLDPTLSSLAEEIAWKREQAIAELPDWSWHRLDSVYAKVRRSLCSQTLLGRPNWRKGAAYALMVARHAGEHLAAHTDIRGKTFLDLGCGAHNPFGTSAVMFLNGARETVSLDQAKLDGQRCAEALFELLSWCALFPDKALWSGLDGASFRERLGLFDAEALAAGDLAKGLANVPMRYVSGDIHAELPVEAGSVEIMSSRDVLEHFLDFPRALGRIAAMMKKGGVASHHIDLADHRMYRDLDPEDFTPAVRDRLGKARSGFHAWSFLMEGDSCADGLCNRLRADEFRGLFRDQGFEILSDEPERASLPAGVSEKLSAKFKTLALADLETVRLTLVVRRR